MTENEISKIVLNTSIKLQNVLGHGLLESTYEQCLAFDLKEAGLKVDRQVPIPINYKGLNVPDAYRADMIIEDKVIIELKAVKQLEEHTLTCNQRNLIYSLHQVLSSLRIFAHSAKILMHL